MNAETIIRPTKKRVLVELVDPPKESAGGILLVNPVQTEQIEALISAVGSDCGDLMRGNRVLIRKYMQVQFKRGDRRFAIVDADNVIAKLTR